jgi:hypothetical protein
MLVTVLIIKGTAPELTHLPEKGIFKIGQSFNYTHSHENSLTFRDDILLGAIPPMIVSLVGAIPRCRYTTR